MYYFPHSWLLLLQPAEAAHRPLGQLLQLLRKRLLLQQLLLKKQSQLICLTQQYLI